MLSSARSLEDTRDDEDEGEEGEEEEEDDDDDDDDEAAAESAASAAAAATAAAAAAGRTHGASQCGWCVRLMTRSQVRPAGLRYEGELAVMTEMGSSTVRLLTTADVKPMNPANAPCTALCASERQ